jgi:hypothetical protein
MPGQRIHASVAFYPPFYCPKAKLMPEGSVKEWTDLVGGGDREQREWTHHYKDVLELDIFDDTRVKEIIERLKSGPKSETGVLLHRLLVMTWSCKLFGFVSDTS